jgi:hypothetical protein
MTGATTTTVYQLETYEHNGYHDSYFYAITFDPEARTFGATETGSTAYASSGPRRNIPDATDDVLDIAKGVLEEILYDKAFREAADEAAGARRGAKVRSLTTRGKNIGIEGTVVWIGDDNYRTDAKRVGIKVDGEDTLRYMPADKVVAIDPATVNVDDVRYVAHHRAARIRRQGYGWYSILRDAGAIRRL